MKPRAADGGARIALVLAALASALACNALHAQTPCGEQLRGTRHSAESSRYRVVYTTTPEPIAIGKHFVVAVAVCPREGAALPQAVRVDATMPEHRHGMNYRPQVTGTGPGTFRAEGLLFHMPGNWELTFDVTSGNTTQRVTSALRVE